MAEQPPFADLQSTLKASLLATTRTTSALVAEDLPFQRSLDPNFAKELDLQNARLLKLAERLLASAVADGKEVVSGSRASSTVGPASTSLASSTASVVRLPNSEALDRNWTKVVDVVDSLLERADGALDEVRGVIKKGPSTGGGMMGAEVCCVHSRTRGGCGVNRECVLQADKSIATSAKKVHQKSANILKPQKTFEVTTDNFTTTPWKPLLTTKPHAKVSLEQSLRSEATIDGTQKYDAYFYSTLAINYNVPFYLSQRKSCDPQLKSLIDQHIRFKHPYRTEIEEYRYSPSMYQEREPVKYLPYETTTATLVDTPEALTEMINELKQAKEIAVDLEHHDFRSYIGLVSLMQISTRNRDWIVDTLKPWRRKLEALNEVFADPSIIKVLHGSSMDIIWLQRDLGVYIVGLFDTEQAATALHYPKRSLAYLLEKHVNFQAQKQYQLADWRVRFVVPQSSLNFLANSRKQPAVQRNVRLCAL